VWVEAEAMEWARAKVGREALRAFRQVWMTLERHGTTGYCHSR